MLGTLAAGTIALTLRPALRAATAPARPPIELLVISDTHLGYRDQRDAEEQWRRGAAELATAPGDLILHLGDVVDGGRENQYKPYRDTRQSIGKPVHEIPGNHDPPDLFAKYLGEPIDRVVEQKWLRILLLNNSRPDSHDGFLSESQLAWIDSQCTTADQRDQSVLIAMHVPVHENRHPDRGWHVKKQHGQAAFYELAKRHSHHIVGVLHGHFHNGLRGWDDHAPLHEICFPSALYNQDRRLEAQGAPGYNPTEFRPGFTTLRIDDSTLQLGFRPWHAPVAIEKKLSRAATP